MALIHEETNLLDAYHCDAFGELTLPGMVNLAMAMASHQEKKIGQIQDYMKANHLIWVITHNHFTIQSLPHVGDQMTTGTSADSYNRFFTLRGFWVKDASGEELIHGQTFFTLLNSQTRQLVRIPERLITLYGLSDKKKMPKLPRMKKDLDQITSTHQASPEFLDVDGNGHVNNTIALKWVTNQLGEEWFKTYQAKSFTVKYEREILLGQEVTIDSDCSREKEAREKGNNTFTTSHVIREGDELHVLVAIDWQKK